MHEQERQPNLLTRDDTFFGVCQALGEDFGFPPNLLRVALAVALFWNPVLVAAFYAGAGALVALSRWVAPEPRRPVPAEAEPEAAAPAPAPAEELVDLEAMPIAA